MKNNLHFTLNTFFTILTCALMIFIFFSILQTEQRYNQLMSVAEKQQRNLEMEQNSRLVDFEKLTVKMLEIEDRIEKIEPTPTLEDFVIKIKKSSGGED